MKLRVISGKSGFPAIRSALQNHGIELSSWRSVIDVPFEKEDPRRPVVQRELEKLGYHPLQLYEPEFEPWEVEQAELVVLTVRASCGESLKSFQREQTVKVMDKRLMKKHDIALTYGFELIISERVKTLLLESKLKGWDVIPVQHSNPTRDSYRSLYQLTSTNELPPLAPETELHELDASTTNQTTPDLRIGRSPIGMFQRGPLIYHRSDLKVFYDFNHTAETFGWGLRTPLFIISQRCRGVLIQNRIAKVVYEPVVILDDERFDSKGQFQPTSRAH